jgi:hypothetical protein
MSRARDLADLGGSADAGGLTGRNLIINGAMNVAQRGTSSTGVGSANGYFTVDRFQVFTGSTAGRATMSQVADGPDGFANSLKFECTTADTTIAAGENFGIIQILEGQDLQHLKKGTSSAESLTLSFYVKGNASATYTVEMKDNDNDRINTQTFDVTTSWNRVSLTFVPDTTGALDDDNEGSFQFGIWLHAGSDFTDGTFASNTWAARTNGNRVYSSATSFFDSTSRTFFITGVQLEVGQTATPFEHRSYGDELARCRRYAYRYTADDALDNICNLVSYDGASNYGVLQHPVQMRSAPSMTYSALSAFKVVGRSTSVTATALTNLEAYKETVQVGVSASTTMGNAYWLRFNAADDWLQYDAEL